MNWLRGFIRWLLRASLLRRLLLAQMVVLTLLWTALLGFVLWRAREAPELFQNPQLYRAAFAAVEDLADAPRARQLALASMGHSMAAAFSDGDRKSRMSPVLYIWERGKLVYQSNANAPVVRNHRVGVLEVVQAGGTRWRARTEVSPRGTVVTLVLPDTWELAVTISSSGFYLLPLLVSLPFLLLPAWLSIRLALRPWKRLTSEIAGRAPTDLRPLTFSPRHKELRPLVESINHLLQRVSEVTARERIFITDAAHELRTPLAAQRVNAEALRHPRSEQARLELLDNLLRSNERAARMVGQLLKLMRSDAAISLPHTLALDQLAQDRLAVLDDLAAQRNVELELLDCDDEDVRVRGERESLISLFDNLVENAIKYSPPGGLVTVQIERCGDQARLQVSDRGPGIAPEHHAQVFHRFYRVPDQSQPGSGLGLSIVKSVVDKHAGSIQLHSEGGGSGLRVVVLLPLH